MTAFALWLDIQTQWRSDNGCRTGLDYPGVDMCIRYLPVPRKEKPWYFTVIKAMERTALEEWSKER